MRLTMQVRPLAYSIGRRWQKLRHYRSDSVSAYGGRLTLCGEPGAGTAVPELLLKANT